MRSGVAGGEIRGDSVVRFQYSQYVNHHHYLTFLLVLSQYCKGMFGHTLILRVYDLHFQGHFQEVISNDMVQAHEETRME